MLAVGGPRQDNNRQSLDYPDYENADLDDTCPAPADVMSINTSTQKSAKSQMTVADVFSENMYVNDLKQSGREYERQTLNTRRPGAGFRGPYG